jgi:2-hydroxychromene-2-carboxylate isomerase
MTAARSLGDVLTRRTGPRAVVALSRIDTPARLGATLRRRLGRRGRVELYFSFDDPCSAVAVIDLADRLAGRDVCLRLAPVVRRGISDDPAVELKRHYAVEDARRLLRRSGLVLRRCEPVPADDVAFLAGWAASAMPGPALTRFCVAALRHLWLGTDGSVAPSDYAPLWRQAFGTEPPAGAGTVAIGVNQRRMARRGAYDTPAAWVHGQWFFAHDRLAQIAARLDDLGWTR